MQFSIPLLHRRRSALFAAVFLISGCSKTVDRAIADGNAYVKTGQYADAVLQYKKAIQLEPENGEAYYRMGIAEWKQKNGTAAWDALKAAVGFGVDSPDSMKLRLEIGIAALLSTAKQPAELQDELHRIADGLLQIEPGAFESLRAKGYLDLAAGGEANALAWFEKAHAARPADEEMLVSLVQSLYRNGQWQQASAVAAEELKKQPKLAALYNVLYRHHMGAGRKKEALGLVQQRITAQPADAEAYLQLAAYWATLGDKRQENAAIERLLAEERAIPSARLKVGEYQLSRGRAKEAARVYGEAAGGRQKNYLALQAGALAQAGQMAEAESVYNTILSQDPSDGDSLVNRAVIRMSMGQESKIREAIADLEGGLAKNPDLSRARYQIGLGYLRLGDRTGALREWQRVKKGVPDYLDARLAMARLALESGNSRDALAAAEAALGVAQKDPEALLLRAQSLQGLGRLDEAADILEPLGATNPAVRRSADLNLALIEITRGHLSKAERLLAAHASARDRDPRWLEASAELLMARKEPPAAVKLLREAVAKSADSVYLRRVYAQIAYRAGQLPIAVEQYRWLVARAPKDSGLRLGLSEALWQTGPAAEWEKEVTEAISLSPGDPAPRAAYALMMASAERHAEAEAVLREAVRMNAKNGQYWNNLAWSQIRQGKAAEARKSAEQARSLAPEDPDVIDTLAWIQLQAGDKAAAVRMLRELAAKYLVNPTYRYHLAEALLASGDASGAATERRAAALISKAIPAECVKLLTSKY